MKRVCVYRATLNKPSETFVRDQARNLIRYQSTQLGLQVANGPTGRPMSVGSDQQVVTLPVRGRSRIAVGRPVPELAEALRGKDRLGGQFDLVHAHFGPDWTQIQPSADQAGLPVVVTVHGFDVTTKRRRLLRSPQTAAYLGLRRQLSARPARVICVSQFLAGRTVAAGLFQPEQVEVVYIGVDVERLAPHGATPAADREQILFAGRLVEKKGVQDFCAVVRHLRARGLNHPVKVVGDGPLRSTVEALARSVDNVSFEGVVAHDQLLGELGRSRLVVLPSQTAADGDSEALGLIFAEALACGAPVIGYRHGGVPEVVPAPLLCREGDIAGLLAKAKDALDPRQEARHDEIVQTAIAGLRQDFNFRCQQHKLEEVYDEAIAGAVIGRRLG